MSEVASGVSIRALERGDRPQWQALWDGYNAFYGRSGPTALDPAITEQTWGYFFDPDVPVHALVAVHVDRVLGIAHYLFHPSTTRAPAVCYLQDLFTLESARGRGVGRKLVESVAGAARRAGSDRLYWHTKSDNHAARALYDRLAGHCGFIVYASELR